MIKLNEAWLAYVNDRITEADISRPPVEFGPWDTLESLFELHPMFTARWPAISSTPFQDQFDEIADRALLHLAATDSFESWDGQLPAGGWRVITERLMYAETVVTLTVAREPKMIIDRLPQGLTRDQQTKALLLKYLLGHARSIDRRLLSISSNGSLQAFPAMQTLRKQ